MLLKVKDWILLRIENSAWRVRNWAHDERMGWNAMDREIRRMAVQRRP